MVTVYVNGESIETFESMDEALIELLKTAFEDEKWHTDVLIFKTEDLPGALTPVKRLGEHEGEFIFQYGERTERYSVKYELDENGRWCGTTVNGETHTEL